MGVLDAQTVQATAALVQREFVERRGALWQRWYRSGWRIVPVWVDWDALTVTSREDAE